METLSQTQLDLLKSPLPKEAIKQHPTKTYLSSIKAIFVTERMNDVFGVGAWQIKVQHITTGANSMVVVKVEFTVPKYGIYYESFGGNDNGGDTNKNFDLGDAYKGATTDAITKIGSYLGIGIDVFKGLNTPPATSQNQSNKPEPENWLNLFTKSGEKTKEFLSLEKAVGEGKKFTLAQMREGFKVSKEVADQLKTNFNII